MSGNPSPSQRARAALTAAAFVPLAVGLTGCVAGRPPRDPAPPARSVVAPDAEALGPTGSYDVFVRRVDPAHATMTVNPVQYLTGTAAARACAEDGVPDQHGVLCHDFYIRDRSSRLWTVTLDAGVSIRVSAGCGPARPADIGGSRQAWPGIRCFGSTSPAAPSPGSPSAVSRDPTAQPPIGRGRMLIWAMIASAVAAESPERTVAPSSLHPVSSARTAASVTVPSLLIEPGTGGCGSLQGRSE